MIYLGHERFSEEDVASGQVSVHDFFAVQIFHSFGNGVKPTKKQPKEMDGS